jgi:hypothetical protein
VNADVRVLVADAERAVRDGDLTAARAAYVEAGTCAGSYGLWRSAMRCYRRALELDVADLETVLQALKISGRVSHDASIDWAEYASSLQRQSWPHFGCRGAQTTISDHGSFVILPKIGAVLEVMMSEANLVEVTPVDRFAGMPFVMGMIILRRALFTKPREYAEDPLEVHVAFDGRPRMALDEVGDWAATK